jgi:hypothetical protein
MLGEKGVERLVVHETFAEQRLVAQNAAPSGRLAGGHEHVGQTAIERKEGNLGSVERSLRPGRAFDPTRRAQQTRQDRRTGAGVSVNEKVFHPTQLASIWQAQEGEGRRNERGAVALANIVIPTK